jgi:hypothetical protein
MSDYEKDGYSIISSVELRKKADYLRNIFEQKYLKKFKSNSDFNRKIIKTFADDWNVRDFFCTEIIKEKLNQLGLTSPVYCGPVVSHYTSYLETGGGYGLPFHQDYPSMGGSLDSLIIWTSIYDINEGNHSLAIIPGSHNKGILQGRQTDRGYIIDEQSERFKKIIELKAGDLLVMSSFLVHATHLSESDNAYKLSLSQRFNNFNNEEWVEQACPNAYSTVVDRNIYIKMLSK